jgi:hypothetical protein
VFPESEVKELIDVTTARILKLMPGSYQEKVEHVQNCLREFMGAFEVQQRFPGDTDTRRDALLVWMLWRVVRILRVSGGEEEMSLSLLIEDSVIEPLEEGLPEEE